MSLKILYVEDETTTASLTAGLILDYCDKLYVAHNGEDGKKIFFDRNPNLIITDINTPKMNGLEMIREIRKHNKEIHIYVTSSYESDHYLSKNVLRELNVIGFVLKPI